MNEAAILLTLAGVHFVALMSPGPDFALVVQNATKYGRQTGLYIALGLSFGILTQSLLSITGISYLVHDHPLLFAILQFAGGSYLLYLGYGALKAIITKLVRRDTNQQTSTKSSVVLNNKRQAFSKGFATNILNPKALVFFVSLMSTLVPASMPASGKALAVLILWSLSLFWFAFLAWTLSTERLQKRLTTMGTYIDTLCGIIFTAIGIYILHESLLPIFH
ncbi:LysE family translocator [Vibrio marisflavi]|uniref:Threonine efflux protein n=1 Tax=Vibrio marisflavi CECT 7928 TaxID=634439 RepID=A0ABM9A8X2_9VIBR|nr:LysE family translocator [Vibrio marisflavi]CAH0542102.1 Threonine efflux protein [Vibrio marisflavi CECT 7928]